MTDLIGRLRDMANLVGEPAKSTLWEAIAVLEAPLPDDLIKKTVQWLDHWAKVHGCDDVATCARVMERLARERDGWKAQDAEGNRLLAKARQRIEELEEALAVSPSVREKRGRQRTRRPETLWISHPAKLCILP